MNWHQYQYICRRLFQLNQTSPLNSEQCTAEIVSIQTTVGYPLYQSSSRYQSTIFTYLLDAISESTSNLSDTLNFYGHTQLHDPIEYSAQLVNKLIYPLYLILMLLALSVLFFLIVFPAFEALYLGMGADYADKAPLISFKSVVISSCVPAALLLLNSFFSIRLLRLREFNAQSIYLRLFCLPTIRRSYQQLLEVLHFPIPNSNPSIKETNITVHLNQLSHSKLNIIDELNLLLKLNQQNLLNAISLQHRILYALVFIAILYNLLGLMASVYVPIFSLLATTTGSTL